MSIASECLINKHGEGKCPTCHRHQTMQHDRDLLKNGEHDNHTYNKNGPQTFHSKSLIVGLCR